MTPVDKDALAAVPERISRLLDAYWRIGIAEGRDGKSADAPGTVAQATRAHIEAAIAKLSAIPQPSAGAEPVADLERDFFRMTPSQAHAALSGQTVFARDLAHPPSPIEAELRAENERLRIERDIVVRSFEDVCDELGCERDNEAALLAAYDLKTEVKAMRERVETLTRENAGLREHIRQLTEGT